MTVKVLLFALAKDLAGADSIALEVPEGTTVAGLRSLLAERCPPLRQVLERSMIAIDSSYAKDGDLVPSDVEIACIPPVSGG